MATLYERLGRRSNIATGIKYFVSLLVADKRVGRFFTQIAADPAALKKFEKQLVAFICEKTGGPKMYAGPDMRSAHSGLGISEEDFADVIELLERMLNHYQIRPQDRAELLSLIIPLGREIVSQ
jgi:hemoglobin